MDTCSLHMSLYSNSCYLFNSHTNTFIPSQSLSLYSYNMIEIDKEDYHQWAQMIRSDQIPADELHKLFEENPKFSQWYFTSYSIPR